MLKKTGFFIEKSKKIKIENLLKKNKLNLTFSGLLNYIKHGIEAREYSKFIFTKCRFNLKKNITNC